MGRHTKLVTACKKIAAAIDRHTTSGSGAHKRRAAMHRDLAFWATTGYASTCYPRLENLRLPWTRWDRELYWPGIRVACALCLMDRDHFSKAKALQFTGCMPADLDHCLQLVDGVALSIHEVVGEQSPDIAIAVATVRERLRVRLESRALEDILLAAAEGYKVAPRQGYKYTEVFGLCFGSVRRNAARADSHELHVNVGRVVTQMRARATAHEVMPNWKSLTAHLDVGDRFFPHLEVVGDYHTHPYKSLPALVSSAGWEYSPADEASLTEFISVVRARHNPPLFSLVVAVAEGGKVGKGPFRRKPNVVQVPVGDLFFVIGAYRIRLDASYDDNVDLSLPALIH